MKRVLKREPVRRGSSLSTSTVRTAPNYNARSSQGGKSAIYSASERSQMPPPATPYSFPRQISFLFQIESIWAENDPSRTVGDWFPPMVSHEILPPASDDIRQGLYRWQEGVVSPVNFGTLPLGTCLQRDRSCELFYRCRTVFTQVPDTHRFLAVPYDARRENVHEIEEGWHRWHPVGFNYEPHPSSNDSLYSSLEISGSHPALVSKGPSWAIQIFPEPYLQRVDTGENHAGLIGDLGLIVALAVFSAEMEMTPQVMQCFQPHQWVPHSFPHGRTPGRGVVVTIWLDPEGNTSKEMLEDLQNGLYGSFLNA